MTMMKTEDLKLTREWDKTFPKSDRVNHSKVTFVCVCSIGSGPVEHLELVHVSGWF